MLLISSADQYIGYCITSHLAQDPTVKSQLRILCQDDRLCMNFKNQGIDVRKTDYEHPHYLSLAMRNVDHMVLVIGNQVERVTYARNLCRVALRSGVKSIVLISNVGSLCPSLNSPLNDYALVEDEICNMDCAWTILRTDWIQQYFHLWASFAEKHRQFPLPMDASTEFCPIDIQDVCESISSLLLEKGSRNDGSKIGMTTKVVDSLDDRHNGQVYTLTGPQMVNGKKLMRSLIDATHYSAYQYLQMRPMDLQYYLQFLQTDIYFDARLKRDRARVFRDDFQSNGYRFNIIKQPTRSDIQIPEMIDYFDWVSSTSSSINVPHVYLLTGKSPRSLDAFFLENAISFKPLQ
ncbi:unnamed protein product [Absidia cylindrospora]